MDSGQQQLVKLPARVLPTILGVRNSGKCSKHCNGQKEFRPSYKSHHPFLLKKWVSRRCCWPLSMQCGAPIVPHPPFCFSSTRPKFHPALGYAVTLVALRATSRWLIVLFFCVDTQGKPSGSHGRLAPLRAVSGCCSPVIFESA